MSDYNFLQHFVSLSPYYIFVTLILQLYEIWNSKDNRWVQGYGLKDGKRACLYPFLVLYFLDQCANWKAIIFWYLQLEEF